MKLRIVSDDSDLARLHFAGAGLIYNDFSGLGRTGAQYNVLHHAGCQWITRSNTNVRKLFFDSLPEAVAWLSESRGAEGMNWKRCKTCSAFGQSAKTPPEKSRSQQSLTLSRNSTTTSHMDC